MIILLTEPEFRADEAQILNRLLEKHPELVVHVRKPGSLLSDMACLLNQIDTQYRSKLVVHQHHVLTENFSLKGLHFTTSDREKKRQHEAISTSFHSLDEALKLHGNYSYFFCSPVFPSISKTGYSTKENWSVIGQETIFRQKAVALGGVCTERLEATFRLGFLHIAVLGTIWQHAHPELAFDQLADAYSRTIATFTDSDQL